MKNLLEPTSRQAVLSSPRLQSDVSSSNTLCWRNFSSLHASVFCLIWDSPRTVRGNAADNPNDAAPLPQWRQPAPLPGFLFSEEECLPRKCGRWQAGVVSGCFMLGIVCCSGQWFRGRATVFVAAIFATSAKWSRTTHTHTHTFYGVGGAAAGTSANQENLAH